MSVLLVIEGLHACTRLFGETRIPNPLTTIHAHGSPRMNDEIGLRRTQQTGSTTTKLGG